MFFLSGCSIGEASKKTTGPPPPELAAQNQKNENEAPRAMDALKDLSPPEGLKTTRLFAQPVKDDEQRFTRLEENVQVLRDDIDVAAPTLVRLAAVEKDMQTLFRQLSTLVEGQGKSPSEIQAEEMPPLPPLPLSASGDKTPVTETPLQGKPVGQPTTQTEESEPPAVATQQPPAEASINSTPSKEAESVGPAQIAEKNEVIPAKPATADKPEKQQEKPSQPEPSKASFHVLKLRLGEHPDKTRLVLEVSGKLAYSAKISDGKLLITLADTAWDGAREWNSDNAPLLYAYHVADDGAGGVTLTGEMLYDATIVSQSLYPAEGGDGMRLVIDLKSPAVHQ